MWGVNVIASKQLAYVPPGYPIKGELNDRKCAMQPNFQQRRNAYSPFQGSLDAGLSVISWNAGGLSVPKFEEFKQILKRENVDVFGILEAGASTDCLTYYSHPEYNIYCLPRRRQVASGIFVGVKKSLTAKFSILHEMAENKFEAVEIIVWKMGRKAKTIFSYNPPNNEPLIDLLEKGIDENTIIMGDFNAQSTRWGYKMTKPIGRAMEDFIDSTPLELLKSDKPTFISFKGEISNPDLAMVHVSLAPLACVKVLESCSGFGHRAILTRIKRKRSYKNVPPKAEPRWNFKKADWTKYSNETNSRLIPEILDFSNPDKSYKILCNVIKTSALQSMPRGFTRKYKPFWNLQLQNLKAERDLARHIAERSQSLTDIQKLRKKQAALKEAVKEAKSSCYKNFVSNLNYKQDGQKAFNFLRTLNNEECKEVNEPIKTATGREVVCNLEKAKVMAKYYASISRLPNRAKFCKTMQKPPSSCFSYEDNLFFNSPFTFNEFRRAESEAKRGKCAGPDNIPTELLINLGDKAKQTLLLFFNSVWTSRVPAEWRKAEIVPLLKKNKPASDPASYRPISLTNACCKLMERMVGNRLNIFLESNHKITDFQAGFRKKRSTMEQVAYLSQCIKDGFHRKQSTIAVFVDFKAAYDTVWKPKLLEKLAVCGIKGHMYEWIKSLLIQRFARVKYKGNKSTYVQLKNGLPQGSIMSCTLFNVMINDLIETLSKVEGVNSLLFADDLVIYATSSNIPAINDALNKTLLLLEKWCDSNQMTINMEKTVCQVYTLSTKTHNANIIYKNETVVQEKNVKYLGVTLDEKLHWKAHVDEISKSAESRLRLLKRLAGITWGSSQEVLAMTYKSYIRPVLEYGGELLSTASDATCSALDKVQNKALRVITGAPRSTPLAAMEIQTDIEPLHFRRVKASLNLAEKCLRLPVRYWSEYKPAAERLSTQTSFLSSTNKLKGKYKVEGKDKESFIHESARDYFLKVPAFSLSVGTLTKKAEEIPEILRSQALEKIHSDYPDENWIRIYTDGSANPGKGAVGAGFICKGLFEEKLALGEKCTNFDAEIEAVYQSVIKLTSGTLNKHNVVFIIDSQAAILALTSSKPFSHSRVKKTKIAVNHLMDLGWTVAYQWVPSHCDIQGNEMADRAAKEGSNLLQPEEPVTYEQAKAEINAKLKAQVEKYYVGKAIGKKWESLLTEKVPGTLPRKVFTANFRLTTGHDYLKAHLFRIGISDNPLCPLCNGGESMTSDHLQRCPKLSHAYTTSDEVATNKWHRFSKLYWAARKYMD